MKRLVLIAGILASASAARTAPAVPPAGNDDIIVQARRGAVLRSYLKKVARPAPGRQLGRWTTPLCVQYEGIDQKFSTFIQARVSEVAGSVGLNIDKPGCQANILIKATAYADALAKTWTHLRPPRVGSISSKSLPPRREVAAIEAPHIVRWMTASETVNRDGISIGGSDTSDPGVNPLWQSSLIRSATREDVRSKIILIDAGRLANVSIRQLADYLTFVTLASPDIARGFSGTDSIMSLFDQTDAQAPSTMTRQDLSFLDALYSVPMDRPADSQQGRLFEHMQKP